MKCHCHQRAYTHIFIWIEWLQVYLFFHIFSKNLFKLFWINLTYSVWHRPVANFQFMKFCFSKISYVQYFIYTPKLMCLTSQVFRALPFCTSCAIYMLIDTPLLAVAILNFQSLYPGQNGTNWPILCWHNIKHQSIFIIHRFNFLSLQIIIF